MEAVDMNWVLRVVVFVVLTFQFTTVGSFEQNAHVVNFRYFATGAKEAVESIGQSYLHRAKRDASTTDPTCKKQETDFLKDIRGGKRIESRYTFSNKTHFNLAMAWASDDDSGTLIVVTTEVINMMIVNLATSNVWRSTDYGRSWVNIDDKLEGTHPIIRKDDGVQRNPHEALNVYLLSYHEYMYTTINGGATFNKVKIVDEGYTIAGSLVFHTDNLPDQIMAISSSRKLYVTKNNFGDSHEICENVVLAKWGTSELKQPDAIFALVGADTLQHPSSINKVVTYSLKKFENMFDHSPKEILTNVIAFGIQGKFLYASIYKDKEPTQTSDKLMMVSNDGGRSWQEAQLPTLTGDRFYSVLDMTEGLIFMHVDNPGDTGTGTLYTSASTGVIYSESLQRHLYPNYGSVTDFYKADSMRGVYIASQLNEDQSIHTMITFNQGAIWQPIVPPQEYCKDTSKPCQLQIHNYYSMSRGVKARPPLSTKHAPGIILVHGHAADALQTTLPDVYITTDGGYNWRKTLDGPHNYQIGDSGGFIAAVSTADHTPKIIKFSTDEGHCWHEYKFTNDTIMFTGLLTEPGGKSMTVSIWGYTMDETRKWVVHVINFKDVISQPCHQKDYESWIPHSEMRKFENKGVEGCLLGQRETFLKLKKDSWCCNGYSYKMEKTVDVCKCTREDYECDYSYYRPPSTEDCIKEPTFHGKEIDICLRGHEEEIVTEGYRKIPGDLCKGGVQFSGNKINMKARCIAGSKVFIEEEVAPVERANNSLLIATIVIIVLILVVTMTGFFGYKMYLLRKHKVVYRYSLMNQNESEDYDNEFENALSQHGTLYDDSSDEEALPKVVANGSAGMPKQSYSKHKPKVKSFHDDSDDDLLE